LFHIRLNGRICTKIKLSVPPTGRLISIRWNGSKNYDFNHQDIKLRWEMFINRVDEIYVIEYVIADRNDKLPLHLKIWDSHD
jgi:hypothetical protein